MGTTLIALNRPYEAPEGTYPVTGIKNWMNEAQIIPLTSTLEDLYDRLSNRTF